MATRRNMKSIATEIVAEAGKLNASGIEILQIATDVMKQYNLNQVERGIVQAYIDEMLENEDVHPSEK